MVRRSDSRGGGAKGKGNGRRADARRKTQDARPGTRYTEHSDTLHLARLPGCPPKCPRSEHDDGDVGNDVDSFHSDSNSNDCEGEGNGPNTDDDGTTVGFFVGGTAEKWAECVQEVLSMPKLSNIFQEDCFSLLPPIPYPLPCA